MNEFVLSAILGAAGGTGRVAIAVFRANAEKRDLLWKPIGVSMLGHLFAGIILGTVVYKVPQLSVLAGYAGMDLVETLTKAMAKPKITIASAKGASAKSKKSIASIASAPSAPSALQITQIKKKTLWMQAMEWK